MSEWINAREAAVILGVHKSNIPKMRRRGLLSTRPDGRRPAFDKAQVLALRDQRALPKPPKPAPEPKPRKVPQPPDTTHDWLNSDELAALLGITRNGVNERCRVGTLTGAKHDGRRWFRLDHLEPVKSADEMKRGHRSL